MTARSLTVSAFALLWGLTGNASAEEPTAREVVDPARFFVPDGETIDVAKIPAAYVVRLKMDDAMGGALPASQPHP